MTRKRFIKLLMSRGVPRNRARAIAFLYNASGTPYKKAYSNYLLKTSFKSAISNLTKAIVTFSDKLNKTTKSFNKLAESFNKLNKGDTNEY